MLGREKSSISAGKGRKNAHVAAVPRCTVVKEGAENQRAQLSGRVSVVTPGAGDGQVKIDIGGGNVITSSITEEVIADLELAVGDTVTVPIKSSDVLIAE
jgi:molybdopterin-binding protein